MKKCLWLLLCLFLVGCKDKKDEKEDTPAEATYLYDYALSINTYESLMDIETNYLSVENNTKHFEYVFKTNETDEAPFDPYMPNWINVGDSISVINNFIGDIELFQFSVTSQSYVLIESTNAYCFVYDESGNRITESYDDTYHLTTGNYIVLLQYQDYSTGINPTLALSYN